MKKDRPKGGRPKKKAEDKVNYKSILINYNMDDYNKLIEISSKYDLNLTSYIRQSTLTEKELKGKFVELDYKKFFVELNRVGVNINQISKRVNYQIDSFKDEETLKVLTEIKDLFIQIKGKL